MFEYKLYFLDSAGHVLRAKSLCCSGDAEAVRLVLNHPRGRAMELWHGATRLRSFPAIEADADVPADYVVYFFKHDAIVALTTLDGATDIGACTVATHIFQACADTCDAFEVWQGDHWIQGRLLACLEPSPPDVAGQMATSDLFGSQLAAMERRHQHLVIDREMRLQESYEAIRKSRKLMETVAQLTPLFGSFGPAGR